jgi:hypothetical protein
MISRGKWIGERQQQGKGREMVHLSFGVVALLFLGAPAYAQALDNGAPLQFNYEYHCNGERIIVGHCRDSDPASYCEVYYPDRAPAHPGYQVSKAEMLGDVLKKLSACSDANHASNSSPRASRVAKSVHVDPADVADERRVRPAAARDGHAYLSCVTNDPDWQPPLTIIIDEAKNDVRVSGATASGSSPNPQFNPTSVVFGFAGRQFVVDRVNLSLTTIDTSLFGNTYKGVCKIGAPPKRAF